MEWHESMDGHRYMGRLQVTQHPTPVPCPDCAGTGFCPVCKGNGLLLAEHVVDVCPEYRLSGCAYQT